MMSRYGRCSSLIHVRCMAAPAASRACFRNGEFAAELGISGETYCRIRLQLCKPVTWPPLIFGVIAGRERQTDVPAIAHDSYSSSLSDAAE